jgi:hypothetical protein
MGADHIMSVGIFNGALSNVPAWDGDSVLYSASHVSQAMGLQER